MNVGTISFYRIVRHLTRTFKQSTKNRYHSRTMSGEMNGDTVGSKLPPKCSSHFVHVNGIPTKVIKVDGQHGLVDGSIKSCMEKYTSNVIFLIIPGNPGIADFYEVFMETLFQASECRVPVWAVSHAGHIEPPKDLQISGKDRMSEAYSLDDQIQHKAAFISEHIPHDKKLILIGHSIGCHISLEVMKAIPTLPVIKTLQLFPTIERMWASPNGTFTAPITIYLRWLGVSAAYLASYLSKFIKWSLVSWYFKGRQLLKLVPTLPVIKVNQLFPVIERLPETPNLYFYGFPILSLLHIKRPALMVLQVLSYMLPYWLKFQIAAIPGWGKQVPKCAIQGAVNLFNPYVANSAMYMAACEMKEVVDLDMENIRNQLPKLLFYYGTTDGWCPMEFYHDIKALFPKGDFRLCQENIEHAFVLESSELMADMVWDWMKKDVEAVN